MTALVPLGGGTLAALKLAVNLRGAGLVKSDTGLPRGDVRAWLSAYTPANFGRVLRLSQNGGAREAEKTNSLPLDGTREAPLQIRA
jgi:hypothetical protein